MPMYASTGSLPATTCVRALTIVLLPAMACGGAAPDAAPTSESPWLVGTQPTVDIGSAAQDPAHQLFRVTSAQALADGGVAVGNAGSGEVRIYSAEGDLTRRIGHAGEGPGEIKNLRRFWILSSDTTIIFDSGDRTVVTFSPDGSLVSDETLERRISLESPEVLGRLSDGTLVVQNAASAVSHGAGKSTQDTALLARYSADGRFLHRISEVPGRILFVYETPGRVHFAPLHLGPLPSLAVGDSVIYLHDGAKRDVTILGIDGEGRGHLDLGAEPSRITEAEREAYRRKEMELASTPATRRATADRLELVPYAPTHPTASRILIAADGEVWVQRYRSDLTQPTNWAVFRDGELVGDVEVPAALTLLSIGHGALVAHWRDRLDVEHVRRFRLTAGSGSRVQ